jgi:hypothetical protein
LDGIVDDDDDDWNLAVYLTKTEWFSATTGDGTSLRLGTSSTNTSMSTSTANTGTTNYGVSRKCGEK